MSHEFKTPLSTLRGTAELILEDEDTIGWTDEDWGVPPAVPSGCCSVLYIYDPSVALPRGVILPIYRRNYMACTG